MKKEDNLPIEYINDEIEKYNNNVDELINLLHIQVDKYGLPQPSFFKSNQFKINYQNQCFIEMYIKYIKSGMYSQLYLSERLYLLYFHGKYYFKNRKLRKEYQYLHDVLNPYLYNKNKWVWVIFWGIVLHSGDIILLFQCIFFWMIKYIKFIVPFQWIKVMCDIFIIFNIIFSIVYYLFIMF